MPWLNITGWRVCWVSVWSKDSFGNELTGSVGLCIVTITYYYLRKAVKMYEYEDVFDAYDREMFEREPDEDDLNDRETTWCFEDQWLDSSYEEA